MHIDAIITHLMRKFREQGWISPTVYAASLSGMVRAFFLASLEGEPQQKAHQLFVLGREKGQAYTQDQLAEVILASQVWITASTAAHVQAQTNPQFTRSEGLALWRVANSSPWQMEARLYTFVRNSAGIPVELIQEPEKQEQQDIILLPIWAFCAGWRSRHLSDVQVEHLQSESLRVFLTLEHENGPPLSS